jgi:hypothetical protein
MEADNITMELDKGPLHPVH